MNSVSSTWPFHGRSDVDNILLSKNYIVLIKDNKTIITLTSGGDVGAATEGW